MSTSKATATATSGGGLGFTGALTILFIALKLLGKISWSWWWVLSPLWIGFAAGVVFLILFFTFAGLIIHISDNRARKRAREARERMQIRRQGRGY